jgi:hypothetical protein
VGKFIDSATIPDDIMQPHVHTHKLAEYSMCLKEASKKKKNCDSCVSGLRKEYVVVRAASKCVFIQLEYGAN